MSSIQPGTLVRCVKQGPWRGPDGDVGPRYDDRLVVLDVRMHPRVKKIGLSFAEHGGIDVLYDARFFRPVTFTRTEVEQEEYA